MDSLLCFSHCDTALVICIGVWGCISWQGVGPIVPLHGSVTGNTHVQILSRYAIPTMHCMFPHGDGWLQEDNAAPHKSKVAAAFHANKGFLGLLKVQNLTQLRIFGLWSSKAFTSKRKTFKS